MAPRRIASLTALLSFIALVFTSVCTYLAPRGPGSSDWTALGVTKHKWMALHTDLGIIFVIACLVHIFYNIKPIATYLKDKLGKSKVFNVNFSISLLITCWVIIGSLFSLPPFGAIQNFKADRGNRGRHHPEEAIAATLIQADSKKPLPSEPPLFYSGRSMSRLSEKYKMDIPKIIQELEQLGIEAKADWTFKKIAEHNDMDAKSIYEAVLQKSL